MGAGVAREDRATSVTSQFTGEIRVAQDVPKVLLQLPLVAGDEVVARAEEPFAVVPRSGNEGDTARERLEGPDRRDSRQSLDVRPARHVHSDAMSCERLRRVVVCEPAP